MITNGVYPADDPSDVVALLRTNLDFRQTIDRNIYVVGKTGAKQILQQEQPESTNSNGFPFNVVRFRKIGSQPSVLI